MGREFFSSFLELLPTSTQKITVKDYHEEEALKFSLKMPLKPASTRLGEALQVAREEITRKRAEERARSRMKRQESGGRRTTQPGDASVRPKVEGGASSMPGKDEGADEVGDGEGADAKSAVPVAPEAAGTEKPQTPREGNADEDENEEVSAAEEAAVESEPTDVGMPEAAEEVDVPDETDEKARTLEGETPEVTEDEGTEVEAAGDDVK